MKRIICLIFSVIFLSSCGFNNKYEKTIFSMDTHITITAYGNNVEKALIEAEKEIKRINEKFKISNVKNTVIENDKETQELLSIADEIKEKTGGAFDIRIAPVMRLWGFYSEEFGTKEYKVPKKQELEEALIEMKNGNDLDFGAIAKGYCADRVIKILKESGVRSAVLSLGGNVAVIGKNPSGKDWKVGIKNPFESGVYATITTSDKAVVTSGDYIRNFYKDNKKYHHIIDTKTGYPADNTLTSVTVIDENSTKADALSTALFVMGKDKAIEYWKKDKSFSLVLIEKNGTIHYTSDLNLETDYEKQIIE